MLSCVSLYPLFKNLHTIIFHNPFYLKIWNKLIILTTKLFNKNNSNVYTWWASFVITRQYLIVNIFPLTLCSVNSPHFHYTEKLSTSTLKFEIDLRFTQNIISTVISANYTFGYIFCCNSLQSNLGGLGGM